MKAAALILLFPFTVFIAETISFPTQASNTCKKLSCTKMMDRMSCSHKKDNCEKPSGKKDDTSPCSICPVCSTFVFQAEYVASVAYILLKKDFPLINTGYISSYASEVWKPPNNYLHKT